MKNPINILLVEDNLEMAENICSILKLAMYEVIHACNGREGIELLKKTHPDLIICDIMMPQLDGYGVLHIVSSDPDMASIPFIFLTAKSETPDLRSGMNMGADDYITKPFHGLDLLKVINVRLKKNQHIRQSSIAKQSRNDSKTESAEVETLILEKHIRRFRKKELIFMEGQSAFDLYYIISGSIKTYKVNYEGKELITGFHQAGDFFGYVPLLEGRSHHESAEVREDAEIAIIPKNDFLELIYSNKKIAQKFMKLLSTDLIESESRLLDIAYQSVRQRVAGTLLKIHKVYATGNASGLITITRKDISNMIGTATESLNRTLADFKEEGLIEIVDDGIRIISQQKLERNCKQPNFSNFRA